MLEELGELSQVGGKCIEIGGNENHWSGNIREMFVEELADVSAAIDFFIYTNFNVDERDKIETRSNEKYNKFCNWHRDGLKGIVQLPVDTATKSD